MLSSVRCCSVSSLVTGFALSAATTITAVVHSATTLIAARWNGNRAIGLAACVGITTSKAECSATPTGAEGPGARQLDFGLPCSGVLV